MKYWPGSMTWEQITERIRSWSDGPITRDEAYEVMHIASVLGVFMRREEKQVSERDTKFAGFAAALLKEIDDAIGKQSKEAEKYGLSDKDEKRYAHELGTIIARRAYDLVKHTIECTEHIDLDRLSSDEHTERIPDLTELPEVAK